MNEEETVAAKVQKRLFAPSQSAHARKASWASAEVTFKQQKQGLIFRYATSTSA
jgi:hypothetical protein